MRLRTLIILSIIAISCEGKFEAGDLVGKWNTSMKNMETNQYSNQRYYFEFHQDGQFSAQIEMHKKSNGTWRISGDSIYILAEENTLIGTITAHPTDSMDHLILDVSQVNEGNRRLQIDLIKYKNH